MRDVFVYILSLKGISSSAMHNKQLYSYDMEIKKQEFKDKNPTKRKKIHYFTV